jgi:hypothetical protein
MQVRFVTPAAAVFLVPRRSTGAQYIGPQIARPFAAR